MISTGQLVTTFLFNKTNRCTNFFQI